MTLEEKMYSITSKNTAKARVYKTLADSIKDYESYAWLLDRADKTAYSSRDIEVMFNILKKGSVAA